MSASIKTRRYFQPVPDEGCSQAALGTLLGMPPTLLPDFSDSLASHRRPLSEFLWRR